MDVHSAAMTRQNGLPGVIDVGRYNEDQIQEKVFHARQKFAERFGEIWGSFTPARGYNIDLPPKVTGTEKSRATET